MADLQGVIGLLYRADWTRLSISAEVRLESDQDLQASRRRETTPTWVRERLDRHFREDPDGGPPTWAQAPDDELQGYHSAQLTLLIAPGGRYRQEYGDTPSGQVTGSDGEHSWIWDQHDLAPSPFLPMDLGKTPLRHLLCPSELVSGFTLEVRGPVTACGRDAITVGATPRTGDGDLAHLHAGSLADHLEVIVDAELGILLRYEETFEGQRLSLTELTAVVLDPPEAADRSRFAPPAGSRIGQDPGESLRQTFSGPGWETAKTIAGLAAGGLGVLTRFTPSRLDQWNHAEAELQSAMPPAEPAVLETEGGPPPPDDLLYLLYRSGQNPAFTAIIDEWHDLSAMTARVPDSARAAGYGGVGYLIDSLTALTKGRPVARTVSRLRVSGPDRYRVDYLSRSGRNNAKTIACDGEHRWQVFAAQIMVGPASPPPRDIANVVDPSWLLGCRLSGGAELSYRGRHAYQLSVARGGDRWQAGPLLFFPADVIVDAELGCLLRLISFAGRRPASWYELSGIGTEPVPLGEFRPETPPGVRVVTETGNPFTDAAAVMPGAAGCAVRTAADVVRRTSDAVSATRSFLGDLRSRRRS
jgi:outer membrane lipoprotein-sorting protein